MAKVETLSRRLISCDVSVCNSCMYDQATKRLLRPKKSKNPKDTQNLSRPGEYISVDRLISQSPGLTSQMRGRPTHQQYTCTPVYVDQFANYTYTYLQKSFTAEAAMAIRRLSNTWLGWDTKLRQKHCIDNLQKLAFAAVGEHQMNRVAKYR